jgi:hypothetical protein
MRIKMKKFLALFIILVMIVGLFIQNVNASTVETRYMRSDSWTVNGLSAYKLGTSQTGTAGSVKIMDLIPVTTIYLGIRVWIRSASGTETEVTSGSAVAVASSSSTALISATWSCPSKTLASTDCIVIRVYAGDSSPPMNLEATFVTEQLGASSLDSATWTVYYYLYRVAQGGGNYAYYYRWDTSTYNSRITNFAWTAGTPPAEERTFSFTETVSPSTALTIWQEQFRSFTEPFIFSSTLQSSGETVNIFIQTITFSETIAYWQELRYVFAETLNTASALSTWQERAITIIEHTFVETVMPKATLYYALPSFGLFEEPYFKPLLFSGFAILMCLFLLYRRKNNE